VTADDIEHWVGGYEGMKESIRNEGGGDWSLKEK